MFKQALQELFQVLVCRLLFPLNHSNPHSATLCCCNVMWDGTFFPWGRILHHIQDSLLFLKRRQLLCQILDCTKWFISKVSEQTSAYMAGTLLSLDCTKMVYLRSLKTNVSLCGWERTDCAFLSASLARQAPAAQVPELGVDQQHTSKQPQCRRPGPCQPVPRPAPGAESAHWEHVPEFSQQLPGQGITADFLHRSAPSVAHVCYSMFSGHLNLSITVELCMYVLCV